jgi:hypothetical protein
MGDYLEELIFDMSLSKILNDLNIKHYLLA